MTEAQLTHYASWASIISLFMSMVSLLYVRSIKHNIIRYQRKLRVRHLLAEILAISPHDAVEPVQKLIALRRNLPVHFWSRLTARGRLTIELHKYIEAGDMIAVQEAIFDWLSYSGDL